MESRQGLTQSQAVALLELARQKGKPCLVKINNKEVRNRPGRGILKSVLNSGKVIVRPFKHGHDEEELLSNIFFWQGGMGFEFEEVVNMAGLDFRKPLGEKLSIPMSVVPTGAPVGEFVIFSAKMKAVWGGNERRWTQSFNLANKWKDHGDGMRAVGKINKVPMQDDAKLLPLSEAHDALLEVLTAPQPSSQNLPFKPQAAPAAVQQVRPTAPALSASLLAAARPQPAVQIDLDDDDLIDLDILLGKDNASLKLAEEERRKAAAEYGLAKKAVKEAARLAELAFKKFFELDQRCAELGGQASLKTAEKPSPKPRGKRLVMFPAIKDILTVHSRLNVGTIYEKLVIVLPEAERSKLHKNLSNYKKAGLLELDDNGGWALTEKGRHGEDSSDDED